MAKLRLLLKTVSSPRLASNIKKRNASDEHGLLDKKCSKDLNMGFWVLAGAFSAVYWFDRLVS